MRKRTSYRGTVLRGQETPYRGRQSRVSRGEETPYRGRQSPVSRGEEIPFHPYSRLRQRRQYAAPEAKEYVFATVTFSHATARAPRRFSTLTLMFRLARTVVATTLQSASTYVGAAQPDSTASRFPARLGQLNRVFFLPDATPRAHMMLSNSSAPAAQVGKMLPRDSVGARPHDQAGELFIGHSSGAGGVGGRSPNHLFFTMS
jgi:hypothetical protein